MDDIEALKRREAELVKQIAAAKQETAALKQTLAGITSREPQTDHERLVCICGLCIGMMQQAGYNVHAVEILAQLNGAISQLSSRTGKDLAASVMVEIRKIVG